MDTNTGNYKGFRTGDIITTALGYRARIKAIAPDGWATLVALEPSQAMTMRYEVGDEYELHAKFFRPVAEREDY